MFRAIKFFTFISVSATIYSCTDTNKQYEMGTYGYDLAFFAEQNIKTVELCSADGESRMMIIPAYQGRVMTTTTEGYEGNSYGWINYDFIRAATLNPQFNPTGGEERFWIGPEGGPNSYYFKKGDEQVYANWKVPAAIDTETYDIAGQTDQSICFVKDFELVNASDNRFDIGVKRTISLLDAKAVSDILGTEIPAGVKYIAYSTDNEITNRGEQSWNRDTGMPSVWLLGMFNPTSTTTVFIPYDKDFEGRLVNDEYFGKIPADRLELENGILYFKIDGKYRSKLGLPTGSAKDICGSYDSEKGVLTILKYSLPMESADYVNGQWGEQKDPFAGDVINSYNDGPTDDGTVMGPFYEIETSSPGAALAPGESLSHLQYTMHFQGSEAAIAILVENVFGIELEQIKTRFQ